MNYRQDATTARRQQDESKWRRVRIREQNTFLPVLSRNRSHARLAI